MKNTIWSVVLFIFFFVSFDTLKAQDAPKKSLWDELHFWGDGIFGFGIPDLAVGGGGSTTINYGRCFISLRGMSIDATPLIISPISFFGENVYHGYSIDNEAALCIGVVERGTQGAILLGAGISYVNRYNLVQPSDSLDNGHRNFHSIGFAIDAQFTYSLLSWFGIVLHPFMDLNPKKTFGGIMFGIQMGKLFYQ